MVAQLPLDSLDIPVTLDFEYGYRSRVDITRCSVPVRFHENEPPLHRFHIVTRRERVQDDLTAPTKLFIFESSEMGCQLLAHELEKSVYGLQVVGYRSSSPEVDPEAVREADVALISSGLRDGPMSGFNVLRALRGFKDSLRCIMLLDRDDPELILEAFRSGAAGIFERNDSCERLCKCIQRVREGQVWANGRHVNYLIEALGTKQSRPRREAQSPTGLTRREEQIVTLLLEGRTNRDIALHAHLSVHTVKNNLFRLFKKLGVSSRSELIAYALQKGQAASNEQVSTNLMEPLPPAATSNESDLDRRLRAGVANAPGKFVE